MAKNKLNITLDEDLIEFSKSYASEQRTTVSELVSQFLLNLKRTKSEDPTEIIISDPQFNDSLLDTISRIRQGKEKWLTYDEVFK
ncbi:MAG: hypothetical protein FJW66_09285 [Actinobacteria bacterium]|nr:hypothetical protein [Actinomycetota bacterium]